MIHQDVNPQTQLFETSLGRAPGRGRLTGKRALIVGAGQRPADDPATTIGNGRAMSLLFAREGAAVACVDRDAASAQETADLVRAEGGTAEAIIADVSEPDAIGRMFDEAVSALGALDIAVANIGVSNGHRLHNETPQTWDAVMAVNLRAHMLIAQRALTELAEGGTILFVSSAASVSPLGRNPAYESSKAALSALARATAVEGQARGIRANAVAPGLLDTPMGRAASARNPARATRPVPFGRQGTAWEMAYASLFLVCSESSYVNAQTLFVDAGANQNVVSVFRRDGA
ncbi:SDR family NAD(P)-dependent oxidoreductase [Phenylobacterium terrae]|uniref:SDR family NAD(P)-dependent oxidoreductase n=1 Tax=Phenylobacterium terrae TaxID=2665495 RepID=A0ABW4N7A6_9CAUL